MYDRCTCQSVKRGVISEIIGRFEMSSFKTNGCCRDAGKFKSGLLFFVVTYSEMATVGSDAKLMNDK